MTINQARRAAYRAARILGDVQAVKRGREPQRVYNRALGRMVRRSMRGLWR